MWIKSVNNVLHVFCEFEKVFLSFRHWEVLYVTIGNPAFCPFLNLTGVYFWGELQHVGDVSEQKINCWPIRTRVIRGVRLQDVVQVDYKGRSHFCYCETNLNHKEPGESSNIKVQYKKNQKKYVSVPCACFKQKLLKIE